MGVPPAPPCTDWGRAWGRSWRSREPDWGSDSHCVCLLNGHAAAPNVGSYIFLSLLENALFSEVKSTMGWSSQTLPGRKKGDGHLSQAQQRS